METLQCHPVLLSGGFPLPSGYADRLWDVSYLLFYCYPISRKCLHAQSAAAAAEHPAVPAPAWRAQPAARQLGGTALPPRDGVLLTKNACVHMLASSAGPNRQRALRQHLTRRPDGSPSIFPPLCSPGQKAHGHFAVSEGLPCPCPCQPAAL